MDTSTRGGTRGEAGLTLTELVVVLGIGSVLMATAVLLMPGAIRTARADGAAAQLASTLRTAREQAIAQRRNIRVQFLNQNQIRISRVEVPGPGETVLTDAFLENGAEFQLFGAVADTPDLFGNASATDFGDAEFLAFTSEGSFVDQNGDVLNGTVFLGTPNQPDTARAVSIFGPTATLRVWRWAGAQWVE
ncbi:MAG: prepilin-type N-terminal cleavage/methylation domain-containing protein [Acidobacteria bacterium]|nr:prepilin-type N-terminal cleavage/methylation domain-containing protein [Acidobacteriota bacterium]